jgi:hypothetical protein
MEAPTHNADGSEATIDASAFPEGGLWLCCGAKARQGRGCALGVHEAEAPPPAVPLERRIEEVRIEDVTEEARETAGARDAMVIPSFIESSFTTRVAYDAWKREQLQLVSRPRPV